MRLNLSLTSHRLPMERAIEAFRTFLRQQRAFLTPQRERLVKKILEWPGHFSAEEVVEWAARQSPAIGRATVYRTLRLLRDGRLLLEHEFGPGPRLYEASFRIRHHDHMICIRCGTIREFRSPDIEKLQEDETARAGFTMLSHVHRIYGLCKKCQRTESRTGAAAAESRSWRPPAAPPSRASAGSGTPGKG